MVVLLSLRTVKTSDIEIRKSESKEAKKLLRIHSGGVAKFRVRKQVVHVCIDAGTCKYT